MQGTSHPKPSLKNNGALLMMILAALSLASCATEDFQEAPFVQSSVSTPPRWTVDINRVVDGVFRTYRPRCMDNVRRGHTVEFRNYMPDVPANVSIQDGPAPLYSPNLMRPYNFVSADDPDNTLCEIVAPDGSCSQRPQWSFWRFTFEQSGVYDWLDTNSGAPGRKVVDPYYGTVTFIGIDPNSPFGSICVQEEDGGGCQEVCCTNDSDCGGGALCFRSEVDAVGRCLTPSG